MNEVVKSKAFTDPYPCDDCWNNFHNNEYTPCDENLMSPHCKTLEEWKKKKAESKFICAKNHDCLTCADNEQCPEGRKKGR